MVSDEIKSAVDENGSIKLKILTYSFDVNIWRPMKSSCESDQPLWMNICRWCWVNSEASIPTIHMFDLRLSEENMREFPMSAVPMETYNNIFICHSTSIFHSTYTTFSSTTISLQIQIHIPFIHQTRHLSSIACLTLQVHLVCIISSIIWPFFHSTNRCFADRSTCHIAFSHQNSQCPTMIWLLALKPKSMVAWAKLMLTSSCAAFATPLVVLSK